MVYGAPEFPTVSYVWKAEERRCARVTIVAADDDDIGVATERMCAAIDNETLIVPLSHVLQRSPPSVLKCPGEAPDAGRRSA
ncbi:MAG TPA: hypothetical protein VFH73_15145 [Polyangia bacterium]|nr:hypothetical protein [Polyangia bacterium]